MIAGILHQGSGLGDQLFRYITTRTLALDKGYDWGILTPDNFKGNSFMDLDMGTRVPIFDSKFFDEKEVKQDGLDIRSYDPEINFVEDNTIIDGNFEDEKYWKHRLPEIREWLKVEPIDMPDDVCVINFRGGEFALYPDLFLTAEYWNEAIELMLQKNPFMKFEIHTDDIVLAGKWFPGYEIIQGIALNWRSIRYAKHLILSNSAFGIMPALLNEDVKEVIAPRYWARRNIKQWARPANYYSDKRWRYV